MHEFVTKHSGVLAAIVVSLVGWAFNAGTFSNTLSNHDLELKDVKNSIQRLEGFQETKWTVAQHDRMLTDHTNEIRKITVDIGEMKSDIKLIAEWVRQQKEKQPHQ